MGLTELMEKRYQDLTDKEKKQVHKSMIYDRFNTMADVIDKNVHAGNRYTILHSMYELVESFRGYGYEWKSTYTSFVVEFIGKERGWI